MQLSVIADYTNSLNTTILLTLQKVFWQHEIWFSKPKIFVTEIQIVVSVYSFCVSFFLPGECCCVCFFMRLLKIFG